MIIGSPLARRGRGDGGEGIHILQTQETTTVRLARFNGDDGDDDRREHGLAQAVAMHRRDRSKQSPDLNLSHL